jgi:hypothetical protein
MKPLLRTLIAATTVMLANGASLTANAQTQQALG